MTDILPNSWTDSLKNEVAINAYLDFANMLGWQKVLKWNFWVEDILTSLRAFQSIREIKLYHGTNDREPQKSAAFRARVAKTGAIYITKPVKFLRKTINTEMFFKRTTLKQLDLGTTTLVKNVVSAVQASGVEIEEPKCNFDVEIAMDMLDDQEKVSAVMLFSGDSDFSAPLERLKVGGKRIYVIGVRGCVASELFRVAHQYIDFGKIYSGRRIRQIAKIPPNSGTA